mgnify:CR=1 FL=1
MAIDLNTAREVIDAQFPEFSDLDLQPIESGGTDNTIFRLGRNLSARFPKRAEAAAQIETEHHW